MIKNKGGGRNCEANVHFESFYPSDVINEEGRTGDESGPILGVGGSIGGENSVKIDDAKDSLPDHVEVSRKSSLKMGGFPESSNRDCSESIKNLRSRLGLAAALIQASESSAKAENNRIVNDYFEVSKKQEGEQDLANNMNFFRQAPRSQSFKQQTATMPNVVVDGTRSSPRLRLPLTAPLAPAADPPAASGLPSQSSTKVPSRRREASPRAGSGVEPGGDYVAHGRRESKTARSISAGCSSGKGRRPIVKPQTRRQNISPLIIRSENQTEQEKQAGLHVGAGTDEVAVAGPEPSPLHQVHPQVRPGDRGHRGSFGHSRQPALSVANYQDQLVHRAPRPERPARSASHRAVTCHTLSMYGLGRPNTCFPIPGRPAKKSRVKVMARFRPINQQEASQSGVLAASGQFKSVRNVVIYDPTDPTVVRISKDYHVSESLSRPLGSPDRLPADELVGSRAYDDKLTFKFDRVFRNDATQEQVYGVVGKSIVDDALEGYHSTVIAYGQTGSGKTYTMHGPPLNRLGKSRELNDDEVGIVLRVARDLFEKTSASEEGKKYVVSMQMVEIYKETLIDMLLPLTPLTGDHIIDEPIVAKNSQLMKQHDLRLKESPRSGTYVQGLTRASDVKTLDELLKVLRRGESNRHVNCTRQNQFSSRSHSICTILVQEISTGLCGAVNLVDLAGSERVSKSCAQGEALEEAKKINRSLSALGNVINCIVKGSAHIPYRDSKLTRLLKESFAGSNKTTLIVNCSSHPSQMEETLGTLRFARRAKLIQNKVKTNFWSMSGGVNHEKSKSVLSEQNIYLMGVVQGLKDELSETRRQLKIVRGVRGTCASSHLPLPEEQLHDRQKQYNLSGIPEDTTPEQAGFDPRLLVPGLPQVCPTCGNPTPREGKLQPLQQSNERKRNEIEPRNMSLGSHGSQLKFVQKLRANLDQERSKNQELNRRLRNVLSKNTLPKQGKSSARQRNAGMKEDLQRLQIELQRILVQLEVMREENHLNQRQAFNSQLQMKTAVNAQKQNQGLIEYLNNARQHSGKFRKQVASAERRWDASLTFAENYGDAQGRGGQQRDGAGSVPRSCSGEGISGQNQEAQASRERLQFLTYETTNLRKRSQLKLQIRHQSSSGQGSLTASGRCAASPDHGRDSNHLTSSHPPAPPHRLLSSLPAMAHSPGGSAAQMNEDVALAALESAGRPEAATEGRIHLKRYLAQTQNKSKRGAEREDDEELRQAGRTSDYSMSRMDVTPNFNQNGIGGRRERVVKGAKSSRNSTLTLNNFHGPNHRRLHLQHPSSLHKYKNDQAPSENKSGELGRTVELQKSPLSSKPGMATRFQQWPRSRSFQSRTSNKKLQTTMVTLEEVLRQLKQLLSMIQIRERAASPLRHASSSPRTSGLKSLNAKTSPRRGRGRQEQYSQPRTRGFDQIETLTRQVEAQRQQMQQLQQKIEMVDPTHLRTALLHEQQPPANASNISMLTSELQRVQQSAKLWAEKCRRLEREVQMAGKGERRESMIDAGGVEGVMALTERITHVQSSTEKEERRRMEGKGQSSFDSLLLQQMSEPGRQLTLDLRQDGRRHPADYGMKIDDAGRQDFDLSQVVDSSRAAQKSPQWQILAQQAYYNPDGHRGFGDELRQVFVAPRSLPAATPDQEPPADLASDSVSEERASPRPQPTRVHLPHASSSTLAKQPYHLQRLRSIGRISNSSSHQTRALAPSHKPESPVASPSLVAVQHLSPAKNRRHSPTLPRHQALNGSPPSPSPSLLSPGHGLASSRRRGREDITELDLASSLLQQLTARPETSRLAAEKHLAALYELQNPEYLNNYTRRKEGGGGNARRVPSNSASPHQRQFRSPPPKTRTDKGGNGTSPKTLAQVPRVADSWAPSQPANVPQKLLTRLGFQAVRRQEKAAASARTSAKIPGGKHLQATIPMQGVKRCERIARQQHLQRDLKTIEQLKLGPSWSTKRASHN